MMDPRANSSKPANKHDPRPARGRRHPDAEEELGRHPHRKGMMFAGQRVGEFSGANYSPSAVRRRTPYLDYNDEAIYFCDEPDVVQSLMSHFDTVWTDSSGYADYANVTDPTVRAYPAYPVAPEFNFPPQDSYYDRLHPLLRAEADRPDGRIDVTIYRITDSREPGDLIYAAGRGIPVRLYTEPKEYRNPARIDDSYNVDRMYLAGVQIRMRAHQGLNHQKTVLLYSLGTAVFGTSNWSTASDDNQLEVNYFTTKTWFFDWFRDLFERKWNNTQVLPDGTPAAETQAFAPLPPDQPVYAAPGLQATGVDPAAATIAWNAGFWARQYRHLHRRLAGPAPPAGRPQHRPEPHGSGAQVVRAAGAAARDDLLLAGRVEDDGEPDGRGTGVELHHGRRRPCGDLRRSDGDQLRRRAAVRGLHAAEQPAVPVGAGRHRHGQRARGRLVRGRDVHRRGRGRRYLEPRRCVPRRWTSCSPATARLSRGCRRCRP